ncbi:hypothetical protein ACPYPG_30165 [Streptomyces sp. FR-108]|uniref:hypothetical protein n=1 Tax=Streptomyces sp. FR-108 TaxID=3416665 RepID=UPI003CF9A68A
MSQNQGQGPLLGLRSAVIFLLGLLAATGMGLLCIASGDSLARAGLAAAGAFITAVIFFDTIID